VFGVNLRYSVSMLVASRRRSAARPLPLSGGVDEGVIEAQRFRARCMRILRLCVIRSLGCTSQKSRFDFGVIESFQ
jgi:hypothetical protein